MTALLIWKKGEVNNRSGLMPNFGNQETLTDPRRKKYSEIDRFLKRAQILKNTSL